MKLTKIQQVLFGLGLLVLAGAMAHFLILKGDRQNIRATETRIGELQSKINVAKRIQQRAAILKEEMAHLTSQLERLKKVLPVTLNEPRFMADIKRFANENGLEILGLSKSNPRRDDVIVELPFSFQTRGNYHDYGRFFAQLTNYQVIVNVKGMILERDPSVPGYTLEGSFIVSVFTYQEPTVEELREQIREKKKSKKKKGRKKH